MIINNFYSEQELKKLGLGSFGENVLISKKCSIYGASRIHIGNNVRIDDFCLLSAGDGGILLGNNIHIGAYSLLIGNETIKMCDYSGLSARVSIYSSSDDYSGNYMTNPMVNKKYTNVTSGKVTLMPHVIVGVGSTILCDVTINEGAAIYAMSLITKDCEEFGCYLGIPAKKIKKRSKKLLDIEKDFKKHLIFDIKK